MQELKAKTPSRKIVSKGEYAAHLGIKAALSSLGIGSLLAGVVAGGVACILFLGLFMGINVNAIGTVGLLLFGGGAWVLLRFGKRTVIEAHDMDAGVPFTQANTDDLPPPDTLVRAASEPVQEQGTVLLRAASGSQEQHEGQLVRASSGQE